MDGFTDSSLPVLEDSWINVKACTTNEFCCNEDIDNGNCCEEGGERFDLPAPSVTTSEPSPSSTSTESESTSTNDGGPNPQAPSPSAPSPPPQNDNGGGGLSAGAQGAIGGSIGGVALIAIGIGAFWFLRRRKGKNGAAAELAAGGGGESEKKGYWGGGPGMGGQQQWHAAPAEVEGSGTAVESGGREVPQRYELGG